MKKATMSFEEKRRALSQAAASNSGGKGVTKTVDVTNEAVSTFLKQLREFEKASRNVRIVVK